MNERLYEILMKLPRANLINLMWAALDEMQAYNGRTRLDCVILAIGDATECKEKDNGTMSYKIKSLEELKRNTETMGL